MKEEQGTMEKTVKAWLQKMEQVKKDADLSRDEDLSIALMNMISLEEHFYFTAMKTNNQKYLELLDQIRTLRKTMLAKIVTQPEGEEWCISKHLLGASMRLVEVGTKELSKKNDKEAMQFFTGAFQLYSLFFAINMKMVGTKKLEEAVIVPDEKAGEKKQGMLVRFSEIVKKIVDCCKE